MKQNFRWSTLGKAALLITALSAVVALINLISFDGQIFRIGFPSTIVTLYLDKSPFPAVHVSLSGLALDLLLSYVLYLFLDNRKRST